ncbi:uncharacterized protein LOC129777470 [Toxorhynchites rutilus septentrionalis]|uniref:uncharacterized protein LOC129777470 n=1 Tax=Toxorhynchites rutilus septentrionalis TaxID=329112 RepID=UPI00247B2367|nr:uncharacterized protein LOC129777470 [Toxorhynchites rutilus septentrionalis]
MKTFPTVLIVVLDLTAAFAAIAPVLEVCNRNDPALAQCILGVVDKIRPNIASGDFGGNWTAPPLDPLRIDGIDIDQGSSFTTKLWNITINGVSGFVIRRFQVDLPNMMLNASVKIPSTLVTGMYHLNMNILLLRLAGEGPFNLTLNNTIVNLKIKFYLVPKDGKNYVRFHPIGMNIKFNDARFYLKNLFNGEPTLEAIGNQAINANPYVLLDEVEPALVGKLTSTMTEIANAVVAGSDIDELLPP